MSKLKDAENRQKNFFLVLGIIEAASLLTMLISNFTNSKDIFEDYKDVPINNIIGDLVLCACGFCGYYLISKDKPIKAIGSVAISTVSVIVCVFLLKINSIIGMALALLSIIPLISIILFINSIKYKKLFDAEKYVSSGIGILVKCTNCGKENPNNIDYCIECGSVLLERDEKIRQRKRMISVISFILCLPSVIYCIWYLFNILSIPEEGSSVFNLLSVFIVCAFVLIFFMIEYRNLISIISFILLIITSLIPPILYVVMVSSQMFFNGLGWLCTCGGLDGVKPAQWSTEFLQPFIFIISR